MRRQIKQLLLPTGRMRHVLDSIANIATIGCKQMFIESLKYGLHLQQRQSVRATALNAAYYLFAYFHPMPHTTPLPHCLSPCYSRTVCSLFSHIICNNLHLHIPTAVMATTKRETEGKGFLPWQKGRKLPE